MKCSLCDSVALRYVGKNGYCKVHRPEADKAAARANIETTLHEESESDDIRMAMYQDRVNRGF